MERYLEIHHIGLHPHRSQSAPVNPIQQRPSLLLRGQTSSSHIKALENAYNAAREAGMDMSVNEVIAAIRLAHQIQGALSEELLTRLELGSMNAGKETL